MARRVLQVLDGEIGEALAELLDEHGAVVGILEAEDARATLDERVAQRSTARADPLRRWG